MKHIKAYRIFESVEKLDIESIKNNINDIFLDAIDLGYMINVSIEEFDLDFSLNSYKFEFRLHFIIPGSFDSGDFNIMEVKEYVLRMIDYLKSLTDIKDPGFIIKDIHLFTMPNRWEDFIDFTNDEEDKSIYLLRIDIWIHI